MSAEIIQFGAMLDGRPVRAVRLAWPGGLEVEVIEYGAVVRRLGAPAAAGRVETVLGFETLDEYLSDRMYQGCAVGRVANRIAGARFELDGQVFHVTANEGANCLHGGAKGLSRRLWRIVEADDERRSAVLAYDSPDGEEGFPGALAVRVRFELAAADALTLVWEAETDRPTPVNLTHHLYFNLSGERARPVLDHRLQIAAQAITPVRADLIPTGELMPVEASPFDLRAPRRLGEALAQPHPQLAIAGGGFDQNWALDGGAGPAARLACPETGLVLELTTDQPGLQVYSGQGLQAPFAAFGGLALEPQSFPDAINQPQFGDVVLQPGGVYRRRATYRFVQEPASAGP